MSNVSLKIIFSFEDFEDGRFVLDKPKKPMVNRVKRPNFYDVSLILQICSINTEAVFRRCSVKMMFLKASQNSKERICVRISF